MNADPVGQGLTQEESGKRLSIPKGNIGKWVGAAKADLRPTGSCAR
jgi:hypothetical protein